MRKPWRWALLVILAFFGLGGWISSIAPLSTAVTANGSVSTEGTVQTVQPSEAGIVRSVLVAEGDNIEKGQDLLLLESTQAEGELNSTLQRLRQLAAREERLLAEQRLTSIKFNHWSLEERSNQEVKQFVRTETELFDSRLAVHSARQSILQQRISQLNNQVDGHRVRLSGLMERSSLITPEITNLEKALDEGLVPRSEVLRMQQQGAEVRSEIGQVQAEIARVQDTIAQFNIELVELNSERIEALSRELIDVQTNRRVAEEQYLALQDRISKRTIKAPVSGVVMNLKQSNPGSVVGPGEALLDIIPVQDRLIVDVQIRPVDIDMVYVGQPANVLFSALPSDASFPVDGTVTRISASVLTSPETNQSYYLAQIIVDEIHLRERLGEFNPVVGMPVQVFVEAGERTLLQYLISPIIDLWRNAMREE